MEGTASKALVTTQVNQGFDSLESLWQDVKGITEIDGLDADRTSKVKEQISSAYENMREVRQILST